jgi:hypothetical protein
MLTKMAERRGGRHAVEQERSKGKRRTAMFIAGAVAIAVPAGGMSAYAGWSTSGVGVGEAKATSAVPLAISAGTATNQLYPGAAGDVQFKVKNTNAYPVNVTGWSGGAVASTDKAGCAVTDFTVNPGSVALTPIAPGATVTVTVVGGVTMNGNAPDACQGVGVNVSATLSAAQA